MTGYNGWKNKETWLVNLWLGDTFAAMQEEGHRVTADVIESVTLDALYDAYGREADKNPTHGFMLDLLHCALGEIDYRELAAHYADDMVGADQ